MANLLSPTKKAVRKQLALTATPLTYCCGRAACRYEAPNPLKISTSPGLSEEMRRLSTLAPIYTHKNLAFMGNPETGNTHLAQALGHECCKRGMKVTPLRYPSCEA